jgi:putative transcriptional regulator
MTYCHIEVTLSRHFVTLDDMELFEMIKCHLSRLMGERKLKVIEVARATGLHRNTVTLLYNETATRVDLEAIEALCKLFECGVGDLFEFIED